MRNAIWVWDSYSLPFGHRWHLSPIIRDDYGGRVGHRVKCGRDIWEPFLRKGGQEFPDSDAVCEECSNIWALFELGE